MQEASAELNKLFFKPSKHKLPKRLQVACGFPRSATTRAIGQCWDPKVSANGTTQMFICPSIADPIEVLGTLLHEMIHAAVGLKAGHRGAFRKMAIEVGLTGKMTATVVEEKSDLERSLKRVAKGLGRYPHAPMQKRARSTKPKKWVRYYSAQEPGYRVVVNIDQVRMHGDPRDPWGAIMLPAAAQTGAEL